MWTLMLEVRNYVINFLKVSGKKFYLQKVSVECLFMIFPAVDFRILFWHKVILLRFQFNNLQFNINKYLNWTFPKYKD